MSEDQIREIKRNLCANCGDRCCCHGMEICADANKHIAKGTDEMLDTNGAIHYMNGNDSTPFDWKRNERLRLS